MIEVTKMEVEAALIEESNVQTPEEAVESLHKMAQDILGKELLYGKGYKVQIAVVMRYIEGDMKVLETAA